MAPHRHACRHSVLFYRDEGALRDNVAAFVTTALRCGQPTLVIARPALREQLTFEVHRQHVQGHPFDAQRGELLTLDAATTLGQVCIDGLPDANLFEQVVGAAVKRLAVNGKQAAAYGEMVGLLCERGQYADAVRLEGMWNDLLTTADVALHCGYAMHLFSDPANHRFYQDVRAAHTEVAETPASASHA